MAKLNIKINVNKAQYKSIDKENDFRWPLPATLQNISKFFNYKKYPPLIAGDIKEETTRSRFLKKINNPHTVNDAILYIRKIDTVEFCSWGTSSKFEFKGLEIRTNKETNSKYFVVKLGGLIEQKQTTL